MQLLESLRLALGVSEGNSSGLLGTVVASVPALAVTLLNMVMPTMSKLLASQTRWDNPMYTRLHMVGGYYFGRTLTLLLLFLSYYNLFLQASQPARAPPS